MTIYEQSQELEAALQVAHSHIEMDALEISHCKDAAVIRGALHALNVKAHRSAL